MIAREALDALINLGIAYIVISVVASSVVELISQLLRVRGRVLGGTIRELLGDGTAAFYALPTIRGLRQTGSLRTWVPRWLAGWLARWRPKRVRDSKWAADPAVDFIDAATFASAYAALDAAGGLPHDLLGDTSPFRYQGGSLQLDQVRGWFDQAMRATKRQYRRTAQLALFLFGLIVAVTIDLDSAAILMRAFDPNVLAGELPPPMLGWTMTAAAVGLGAQYWFDLVGRLLGLRTQAATGGVWGRAAKTP